MKITYLSDAIYPYNKGGKEKRLFEITTRLATRGHDVHIYTMKWWKGLSVITENGVTLHAISPLYKLYNPEGKRSIKQALAFSFFVFTALLKEDFDVVDIDHMPYFPIFPAYLIAKIKGKKAIITWHEYWGSYWFTYLGLKGVFGYTTEVISSVFGRKIAVSKLTQKRLGKNTKYIPNGIDFEEIRKAKQIKSFDILFVGRLIKEKNVDFLIDSVKDKFSLGIIGVGPEQERLKKLAKVYPKIKFLGNVKETKKVYGYMKGAKIFAFPSEREGFGIVVLEAIACGTPAIVLNGRDNASRFLVDKKYVCTKGDFARELEKIVKNHFRVSLSTKEYDWNKITDQAVGVYQE